MTEEDIDLRIERMLYLYGIKRPRSISPKKDLKFSVCVRDDIDFDALYNWKGKEGYVQDSKPSFWGYGDVFTAQKKSLNNKYGDK